MPILRDILKTKLNCTYIRTDAFSVYLIDGKNIRCTRYNIIILSLLQMPIIQLKARRLLGVHLLLFNIMFHQNVLSYN